MCTKGVCCHLKKKFCILISIFCLLILFFIFGVVFFSNHYLPSSNLIITEIGENIDIGMCDNKTVGDKVLTSIEDLEYNLILSDGSQKVVKLSEVGNIKDVQGVTEILNNNALSLFKLNNKEFSISLSDIVDIDSSKVETIIYDIEMSSGNEVESVSAYITYDETVKKYKIVDEVYGNIISENGLECLKSAFDSFDFKIDLTEIGFYQIPKITADSEELKSLLNTYNEYTDTVITYNFGGNKEIVDISVYGPWLKENLNEDGSLNVETPFYIDDDLLGEYVSELNSKYTTLGMSRTIKTSTGETKTITTGDYGWWVNTSEMEEDIKTHILNRTSEEKDAIYRQKAVQYDDLDFGNSYVEVSIENQKLWMYVDGECIVETNVVTGNINNGNGTRKGVFSLTYKTRNAVLRGPGYESPVSYWMPFDGDIGLHDATWRSSFGGTIYKYNGSHGCVNMPFNAAKTVYENLGSTMPIIVW